jgi:antitoxin (DNA-binding transcriptional repressor) of toxin-antitoxin stability system
MTMRGCPYTAPGAGTHAANLTIDPPHIPVYPKTMKVSAQYAEEHFSDILTAVDNGEEVEIARPDKPALFLAPRSNSRPSTPSGRPRKELWGAWEGLVTAPTEAEWREIKKEFADQMPDFSKLTDESA